VCRRCIDRERLERHVHAWQVPRGLELLWRDGDGKQSESD
jgi:hypothetical protein